MTYLAKLNNLLATSAITLAEIQLVVFDVDGVLTDGRLYFSAQGETTKVFHVRDGVALKLLDDLGIHVAIMTAKDSPMVRQRVQQLGVQHYYAGVKDKAVQLASLLEDLAVDAQHVCYVGDDMVDLKPIVMSGASMCPSDAYGLIRDEVDLVLPLAGGQGIARLVCDLVLLAQGQMEVAYGLAASAQFERDRRKGAQTD